MPIHHFARSRRISAPASVAYLMIADYHNEHPHILPPRWFKKLEVESGGHGAGTVIRVAMRAFGVTRTVRGVVTEPEPGRVLVESYPETKTVTTFIVEPAGAGACEVTFDTTIPVRNGLEAKLISWYLNRVYKEELRMLDERASARARNPVAIR